MKNIFVKLTILSIFASLAIGEQAAYALTFNESNQIEIVLINGTLAANLPISTDSSGKIFGNSLSEKTTSVIPSDFDKNDRLDLCLGSNEFLGINNDLAASRCNQSFINFSRVAFWGGNSGIYSSIFQENAAKVNHPVQNISIPQPTEPSSVPGLVGFASFLGLQSLINRFKKFFLKSEYPALIAVLKSK
ncbi:hypothetical protein [Gloeothece verrucosa]|uniref:PEP-CTERM protein-sorting domain-containing protein n=1 Tax=Gloeothece verrucosa (strain PCC 7822) TaxID=497965 RepID=E0UB79_GLOV7|nr:hypothetical protein [Gloeothece verrucosa]ADN16324.1 hypothetical protein Cyan7822_4410 [Gloeothece verrucosa PCC 7822]